MPPAPSTGVFILKSEAIDFLLQRASAPIDQMTGPGPDDAQIATLIRIASRVPDHGRLAPWRFIVYRGPVRDEIGVKLADLAERREGPLPAGRREKELKRFNRAPLVIGVVSVPKPGVIPEWEMFLSGGAAAMNLLTAASAMGFGANWISNWYSDDEEGRRILGLAPQERVVGFVHIGNFDGKIIERPRPDVEALYTDYTGPWQG